MISMTCSFNNKIFKTVHSFLKSHFLFLALAATAGSMLTSCEEDPTTIGTGLLPGGDKAVLFSRTDLGLDFYTMYVDSVRSNDTTYIAGDYYNNWFGTTTSEIVTQLNLLSEWDEEEAITVDSVYLVFSIQQYFGDTINPPYVTVYEISEELYKDTVYYSNRPIEHERVIGTYPMEGIKTDTVLKIRIPNAVGEYLLRDTGMLFIKNPLPGQTYTDFRSFFKGVHYLLTNNFEASFMVLNPISSANGIQINYSTPTVPRKAFNLVFSQKNAMYRRVTRDFTTADPDKEIQHINDGVLDTLAYLQGLNGLFPRVKIPQLEQLKSEVPLAINKARLTIPALIDGEDYTDLKAVKVLYLFYTDATGKKIILPDMSLGGAGQYVATKDHYTFDIASFVQEYLEGRIPAPELDIYLPGNIGNSVIFRVNEATEKPKLELTFSKF